MITSFIDSLLYEKDRDLPETKLKGKFFIISLFCFFIFYTTVFIYNFLIGQQFNVYVIIAAIPLPIIAIIYKKTGKINLLVNVVAFFATLSVIITYTHGGGIYSSENVWRSIIIAWVVLISNKSSGIFWFIIYSISFVFFLYADLSEIRNFKHEVGNSSSLYFFFNFFLGTATIFLIVYIYESIRSKFLADIRNAKLEIEVKNYELETHKQEILSSINYAKRIQQAILPHHENILRTVPLSFILHKPRDIVSGDFFWFHEIDQDSFIIACADCTGHGIPGAFMTIVGTSLLNQIIVEKKINHPSEILAELDKQIASILKQDMQLENYVPDGMDLFLLRVNKKDKNFIYSGAKRPAIFIQKNKIIELKGSKFSLGGIYNQVKNFEEIKVDFSENDTIYLFTDGCTDLFGGPQNKKYMIKRFRELLLSIHSQSMEDQKTYLNKTIENWRGQNIQTDDILIIGIKF